MLIQATNRFGARHVRPWCFLTRRSQPVHRQRAYRAVTPSFSTCTWVTCSRILDVHGPITDESLKVPYRTHYSTPSAGSGKSLAALSPEARGSAVEAVRGQRCRRASARWHMTTRSSPRCDRLSIGLRLRIWRGYADIGTCGHHLGDFAAEVLPGVVVHLKHPQGRGDGPQ